VRLAPGFAEDLDGRTALRAVVGEDQPLFREGVIQILRRGGIDVVAATDDADDAVRKARAHEPDVAVLDIRMAPSFEDDGLRAAHEIRSMHPHVGVLVLSQFLEDRYALALLGDRPEGIGYLLKDRIIDAGSFVDAVRQVARGGSRIDSEVVGRLVERRQRRDPIAALTGREREVIRLMAEGRSNQGIADVLVVTVSAVERHVTRIFAKLELGDDPHGHRRVLAVLNYLHHA
jgi:DNA-binding NarL/FixJ family response regulator